MKNFTLSAIASLSFTGSGLAAQDYRYSDFAGHTKGMGEFHCRYDVEGRLEDTVRLREYVEYLAPDLDACMEGAQIWANGMHRYYPYYYFDLDVNVTAKSHKDDAYAITHQVFVPRP
jgi:hypothetical protein